MSSRYIDTGRNMYAKNLILKSNFSCDVYAIEFHEREIVKFKAERPLIRLFITFNSRKPEHVECRIHHAVAVVVCAKVCATEQIKAIPWKCFRRECIGFGYFPRYVNRIHKYGFVVAIYSPTSDCPHTRTLARDQNV